VEHRGFFILEAMKTCFQERLRIKKQGTPVPGFA
jgi:hypothetical protein